MVDIHLSDVLFETWENLLAVVCGNYDNMQVSPDAVNKKRKKLLHLWKKLPMFTNYNVNSRTSMAISTSIS